MLGSVLGKKVGMTQVFDKDGKVIPVTVVDVGTWFITQVKLAEKDGCCSLQLGLPRKRYDAASFSTDWLKKKKDYFLHVKEVKPVDAQHSFAIGQKITVNDITLQEGEVVSVTGKSRGLGFQGVVRRWGFSGGPKAHGSKFHRRPGTSGCLRSQGEIIKGKKFPGHQGAAQVTVEGLKVIKVDKEKGCLFIKGAIPGKTDTLVIIRKQGF